MNAERRDPGIRFPESAAEREQKMMYDAWEKCPNVIRGMIPYPCCPKENMLVFADARGHASGRCPRCGKFARFDYDRMTARAMKPSRGASERFRTVRRTDHTD